MANSDLFNKAGSQHNLYLFNKATEIITCRVPDDYISKSRYPLCVARDVMRRLIEQLKSSGEGAIC